MDFKVADEYMYKVKIITLPKYLWSHKTNNETCPLYHFLHEEIPLLTVKISSSKKEKLRVHTCT